MICKGKTACPVEISCIQKLNDIESRQERLFRLGQDNEITTETLSTIVNHLKNKRSNIDKGSSRRYYLIENISGLLLKLRPGSGILEIILACE